MFNISKENKLFPGNNLPIISQGKRTLLFDDEPILYTGFNRYNNRILGSFLCESDKVKRYIHIILDEKEYLSFKHREISLRSLYQEKNDIFIIDSKFENLDIYLISFDQIPDQMKPTSKSYCPDYNVEPSFLYSTSLIGKDANTHEADPEELSKVQTKMAGVIKSAISSILKQIDPKISILAHKEGSFQIQFKIDLDPNQRIMFPEIEEMKIKNVLDEYIEYPIRHLPKEVKRFKEKDQNLQIDFLINRISTEATNSKNIRNLNREKFIEKMIQFSRKVEELCDIEKKHFSSIELIKELKNDTKEPIMLLDYDCGKKITEAIITYEKNSPHYTTDLDYTKYKIIVYNINIETRKGNARVQEKDSRKIFKPRIRIVGNNQLTGSKFTNSLHSNKEIEVLGKATKFKKRIISLEILS